MKYVLTISLIVLLAASGAALASEPAMEHGSMAATMPEHHGVGTVNQVDMPNGKVNLTHEPIPSLGWPGMSMTFGVKDKNMLQEIRPGQKVEFDLAMEKPGRFLIERITPVK